MRNTLFFFGAIILAFCSMSVAEADNGTTGQQQQYMQAYVRNLLQNQQALVQAEEAKSGSGTTATANGNGLRPPTVNGAPVVPGPTAVPGVTVTPQTPAPARPVTSLPPSAQPPANPYLRPNPWSNTTFNPWAPPTPNPPAPGGRVAVPSSSTQTTNGQVQTPPVPNIYAPAGNNKLMPSNIYK